MSGDSFAHTGTKKKPRQETSEAVAVVSKLGVSLGFQSREEG